MGGRHFRVRHKRAPLRQRNRRVPQDIRLLASTRGSSQWQRLDSPALRAHRAAGLATISTAERPATAEKLPSAHARDVRERLLTMLWTGHRLNNANLLKPKKPLSIRSVRLAVVSVGYAKTILIGHGADRTILVWQLADAARAFPATATRAGLSHYRFRDIRPPSRASFPQRARHSRALAPRIIKSAVD